MNVYLAGWQSETLEREKRLLKAGVFTHRCFSFANVTEIPGFPWHLEGVEAGYKLCLKRGVGIMMDSGVFSLRTYRRYLEKKGKSTASMPDEETFIRLYVDFCKKSAANWDFCVTVDFTKVSKKNFRVHERLEAMGIRPLPVFHGDDSVDWLRRYADKGYQYVCIGNVPKTRKGQPMTRRYLDNVFAAGARLGLEFHGLAMTSVWIMLGYPWKSVDSSSWARAAGYGCIMDWDGRTNRMSTIHVSDRGKSRINDNSAAMGRVREHVTAKGYDFDLLREDHIYRHQYNASVMRDLGEFATRAHRPGTRRLLI